MNASFPPVDDTMESLIARMEVVGEKLADAIVLRNPLPWTQSEVVTLSAGVYASIAEHLDGTDNNVSEQLTKAAHWAFARRIAAIAEHGGMPVSGEAH